MANVRPGTSRQRLSAYADTADTVTQQPKLVAAAFGAVTTALALTVA